MGGKSRGFRKSTRHLFMKPFRKHGNMNLSRQLRVYKKGDLVDVKCDGAQTNGMPHKQQHGKTGEVFDITLRAVGVAVNKRVGGRILRKRIYILTDHVKPSRCQEKHLARVKANFDQRNECKKNNTKPSAERLKRQPIMPKDAQIVKDSAEAVIQMPKLQTIYC